MTTSGQSLRTEAKSKGVFVREATGLVREISPFAAVAIGTFALSIGLAINWTITSTPTLYPGSNVLITLGLALIPTLIVTYLYATLSGAMPRSGGEYVWVSRLVHPAFGFTISWSIFLVNLIFAGMNLAQTFSWFTNGFLFLLGRALNNPALVEAGVTLSRPFNTLVAATVLNFVILLFMMLPTHRQMKILVGTFVVAMLGVVALCLQLLLTSRAGFSAGLDQAYGSGTLQNIAAAAEAAGGRITWTTGASLLAVAWVVQFMPMSYATMYAGEIKNARRNAKVATYAGTLLQVGSMMLIAGLLYKAIGYRFLSSMAYLEVSAPGSYPFDFPFALNYAVLLISQNVWLISLVSIAFILWTGICAATLLFSITRVMFAYSWDRIFPDWVAEVSERTSTPVNAAIVCAVGAEIVLAITIYSRAFANLTPTTVGIWVTWVGVALAAILLPYRKPELWQTISRERRRIAGLPVITWAGILVVIMAAFSLPYIFVTGAGVMDASALTVVGVMVIGGPVLFYIARAIRRRQGVDIDMAYKELPSE